MKSFLILLLLFQLPAMAAPKYRVQVRNQFGGWQQYQTVHHLPSASRSAQKRAEQTGKQHRIIDEDGNLVLAEKIRNRDRSWTNIMTLGILDRPKAPPPIKLIAGE